MKSVRATALALAIVLAFALFAPGAPAVADRPPRRSRPATASVEPSRESPEDRLARAAQAYARGDYRAAVELTRPLLYPAVLVDTDNEVTAHRLLALSYFLEHEMALADQEFAALLQLRPDFELSPVADPPQAVSYLDRLRRSMRDKLEQLRQQREQEEAERRRLEELRRRDDEERARRAVKPIVIERTVEKHHLAIALVPFGVGQLQNGHRGKAWALLSTQIALATASATLFGLVYTTFPGGRPRTPGARQDLASALTYAQIACGAAFWLDVAAGIVDALVYYVPEVVTERRAELVGPVPPARAALTPFVAPGGGGLLLQGAF